MHGYERINCRYRDQIMEAFSLGPLGTKTDFAGRFGTPEIYTEWGYTGDDARDQILLIDRRWPDSQTVGVGPHRLTKDAKPCEHWIPEVGIHARLYDPFVQMSVCVCEKWRQDSAESWSDHAYTLAEVTADD